MKYPSQTQLFKTFIVLVASTFLFVMLSQTSISNIILCLSIISVGALIGMIPEKSNSMSNQTPFLDQQAETSSKLQNVQSFARLDRCCLQTPSARGHASFEKGRASAPINSKTG